ncbi:MAG: hypothetical protein R3E73_12235 [Porticoccaceae bacterium]
MSWELSVLSVIVVVGYFYLLIKVQKRSISGVVKLYVETREFDEMFNKPEGFEIYTKSCPFWITPSPGMEFMPAGIEGATIERVIIDEYGLLEVICTLKVSKADDQFRETCSSLKAEGWFRKEFV